MIKFHEESFKDFDRFLLNVLSKEMLMCFLLDACYDSSVIFVGSCTHKILKLCYNFISRTC